MNEANEILKNQCNINGFAFIFQDRVRTLANASLDCSLFYKYLLHLIEQGNVKITITPWCNHISLSSTNSNTSYSDITGQKVQTIVFFLLNERHFWLLFNFCQPILSNVSWSRLYQRKAASNVKHVSVHVSAVYAINVSDLAKPLKC